MGNIPDIAYGVCYVGIALIAVGILIKAFLSNFGKRKYKEGWADAMGPMKGVVMMALEDEE